MPSISILVPARNEESNLSACVASLLDQDADLELLVADDASTDRTRTIGLEIAARDSRVRVLDVPELPAGWVGKNHALSFAARQATGEWLLFTDADTRHRANSLGQMLKRAADFDMFSLSPDQDVVTWREKALIPRIYRELDRLYRFAEINDPRNPAAAANGQHILIRRAAYERIGGHAAFPGEILEDVALARAAKSAGLRLFFGPAEGAVRTRMYQSWEAMREGWTKNLFLLYGRRSDRLLWAFARVLLEDFLPLALTLLVPMFFMFVIVRHIFYAARLEKPWHAVFLLPGSALFLELLLLSWRRSRPGQTVAWKGREYASWST